VNLPAAACVGAVMMPPADPKAIAHASLCLLEPPYLKHYRDGRFRVWNGVSLTASSLPGPGFNFAAVLHVEPPLDDLLPVARGFFAGCDQGWGILVEGDAGHPMEAELRERGWAVAEDEPAFVLQDIRCAVGDPVESVLQARRGTTEADNAAYQRITKEAFEAPPDLSDAFIPGPGFTLDPDIALFIGSVDGEDVTAAGYSRCGETAVLWGVATLGSHRGRGFGSAISRVALAHAASRGCLTASLRSGPRSIPVYERLGFRFVCKHRTYAHPA
jgi:GNAT superfamily N-acetyltransferase